MKNPKVKALTFTLLTALLVTASLLPGCIYLTTPATTTGVSSTITVSPISPSWTPPTSTNQTPASLPDISDVVARVKPSVVAITTETVAIDFFNRQFLEEGAGSGWIVDPGGIIVTNNHVVDGAKSITVTLDSGESYPAEISSVATDTLNDLAILKINATNLTALPIGNSQNLRVGDWVIAIGNSLGRGIRATVGIVSQLNVSLEVSQDETLYNLIDTSAAINPGNSGGPLVNLSGEVVGITSAKIVETGTEATGFAIATETATPIIEELISKGFVSRAWLGASLYTVDQIAIRQLRLSVDSGVLLLQVGDGTPAANAGLQRGDVIVSLAGQKVTDVPGFNHVLFSCKIGQPFEVKYWRGNSQQTTTVIPAEEPR